MTTTIIEGVELPDVEWLYDRLLEINSIDNLHDLHKIQNTIKEVTKQYVKAINAFNKMEYKEDPEYTRDLLTNLQQYNCVVMGVLTSLSRALKTYGYLEISEPQEGKKLTEANKEVLQKQNLIYVDGAIEMFEGLNYNFLQKLGSEEDKAKRRI
jgi:hypothetical protein